MAKHIFISHAWNKDSNYQNLTDLFDKKKYFTWEDHSVPKGNKIHTEVENEILGRIHISDCFVVIASMDAVYSDWIKKEIIWAQVLDKPILGIKPWGAEKVPLVVQEAAIEVLNWNTESIVEAIRKYS